jgi:hypothetical protein
MLVFSSSLSLSLPFILLQISQIACHPTDSEAERETEAVPVENDKASLSGVGTEAGVAELL